MEALKLDKLGNDIPWGLEIKKKKPELLLLNGIYVPSRGEVKDFPDVTQSHYAVSQVFGRINLSKRVSSDFPDVTPAHRTLADKIIYLNLEKEPNFVDLGSGAGFLGTYFGKNFKLNHLIFSDLSHHSIEHSKGTLNMNKNDYFKTKDGSIEFREGDAKEKLTDLDGGVAVCAPYLIPGVCTVFPQVYSLFAGVAARQGMNLYVGHSNLATSYVKSAADANGLDYKEIYRDPNKILTPEYANGSIQRQALQASIGELLPDTVQALKKIGLKEHNQKYYHDIVVSKLSLK